MFHLLHEEIDSVIKTSEKDNMKEICGLGNRLYGLDQLMVETKRYVQNQEDSAKTIVQVCSSNSACKT